MFDATFTPGRAQGPSSARLLGAASATRSSRAAVGESNDVHDDGVMPAPKASAAATAPLAAARSHVPAPDDKYTTDSVKQFYEGLRRDELNVIRECWFVAQGIDTERFQLALVPPSTTSADDKHNCGCCRRHLRVTEGRTRSSALHLLDDHMFPLFCCPDGKNGASGDGPETYWSLLGSGARDAIQIVGQSGAAWRDVEACQAHLLGPDHLTGGLSSSSGICRALATALDRELQSIRLKMSYPDESHPNDRSQTLRLFLVTLMPLLSRLVALQQLCNSWRQHLNFNAHGDATTTTTTAVGMGDNQDDDTNAAPSVSIQLLNLISAQAMSGDTRTAALCRSLWNSAVDPWYRMLFGWITRGIVPDGEAKGRGDVVMRWSGGDFFVEVATDDEASLAPKELWRHKFRLNASNVPSNTLSQQQVGAAFLIGKGINYLQTCLGECLVVDDDAANETTATDSHKVETDAGSAFSSNPTSYFALLIRSASVKVHSRIQQALHDDHRLLHHLLALKQFLLLGQGDFVASFMAGLLDEFGSGNASADRSNSNQYTMPGMHRHALSEILDASLRGSNAMHFPNDILKRLRVQLAGADGGVDGEEGDFSLSFERSSTVSHDNKLPASSGETVWDRVAFSYTLPDPLVAIVPKASMRLYTQLSRFLLSVRRIDMLLNLTWRQSSSLQKEIQTCAQRCAIHVSEHETYAQANILLRQIAMTRQAMMHFCTNVSSYLMYEVLETEWKRLVRVTESATTLDELIAAHDEYLTCVYRKSQLSGGADGDDLGGQIHELLRLSKAFCAYQEQVFGEALRAVQRAADKRKRAEAQQTSGEWGFKGEIEEEESFFGLADPVKLQDLEHLSSVFNEKIVHLLRTLDRKLNGGRMRAIDEESTVAGFGHTTHTIDEDLESLRFLEFQLNNNGYYSHALNEM